MDELRALVAATVAATAKEVPPEIEASAKAMDKLHALVAAIVAATAKEVAATGAATAKEIDAYAKAN